MSVQVKKSGKGGFLVIKALKLMWKVSLVLLDAVIAITSEQRPKPRYTAAKAQELYEDHAISGEEYARCVHGDY